MKTYHFLAFDVGATSGRAMLATVTNDSFDLKEIHRFPNAIMGIHGRYYWNVYSLYDNLKKSIAVARDMDIKLDSIGIDTWGCDFGYIAEDGTLLGLPRAYRDQYTKDAPEHAYELVPRDELYAHTGIQILPFNSIFQIFQARADKFAPALHASKILFIPDLLSYFCTGKMFTEYTVASTSGMLNATTRTWDEEILTKLGIPSSMLLPLTQPGTVVGTLLPEIAEELGVDQIPVVAVAGHDTAAAVTAVPAADKNFAYLSSGTWSLMGIETEKPILTEQSSKLNYTNEGGIEGTTRFLKNITGMWLLEQSRKCWSRFGRNITDEEIKKACRESGQKAPETDAQTISCIYHSLAHRYTEVIAALQDMASFDIDKLHVIGGGSVNKVMSQLTADTIQMPVIAGPSEATAIGNAMIQAKAAGLYSDRWDMRRAVASNIGTKTYYPQK